MRKKRLTTFIRNALGLRETNQERTYAQKSVHKKLDRERANKKMKFTQKQEKKNHVLQHRKKNKKKRKQE